MPSVKLFFTFLMPGILFSLLSTAQTNKVSFIIMNSDAIINVDSDIFAAGNMNNWNPSDSNYRFKKKSDRYELVLDLLPGLKEFKITRGSWGTVETKLDGQPISNRSFFLKKDTVINLTIKQWQDSFKSPEKVHTASKNVQVLDTAFNIPQLNRKRRIWVYLLPDYQTSGKKYPVVYMHDGQNLFDAFTSGYGEWNIDETMDSLASENKVMAIIVGIDHGDQHRLTEYNPYSNSRFGKGRGQEYVEFLAKTLKPYIDQKFRTKKSGKHTAIAGSSMGGLISMYAVAKYPRVFGKAGIFSPSFWLAPEIYTYISQSNIHKSKIYFLAGEQESREMVPDMKKMYDQLVSQGLNKKYMHFKTAADGKHSEWFWHREFPEFYNWISK